MAESVTNPLPPSMPRSFRTDRNNNPTAFTTELAREGGLILGIDYEIGEPFTISGVVYYTAKLLGDPLAVTIKLIDKVGFYTKKAGYTRWLYIAIPQFVWFQLSYKQKVMVIEFMYGKEGGSELDKLFIPYAT